MPGWHRILKWIDVLRSPVPYSSNFEATKPAIPSWFIFAYQYLFQHIKTPNLSPYATISEERALIIPYTQTIWKMSCKSFYSEVWLPFFLSKFLIWKQASALFWCAILKKTQKKKKHVWYVQVLPTRQFIARTQWKQVKQASKTRRSRKSDPRQFQKKKTITVKFQSKGELCLKNNSNCFILRTLHKRGLTAALQI